MIPLPSIHINGTSRESLLEQVVGACAALRKSLDAIQAAYPNARDYYPQGPAAYKQAEARHHELYQTVRDVLREYEQLAEAIAE